MPSPLHNGQDDTPLGYRPSAGAAQLARAPSDPIHEGASPMSPARRFVPALALVLALAPAGAARAQFAAAPPEQPDLPVDAAFRRATVESLATHVAAEYVFADAGAKVARSLRERLAHGRHDR